MRSKHRKPGAICNFWHLHFDKTDKTDEIHPTEGRGYFRVEAKRRPMVVLELGKPVEKKILISEQSWYFQLDKSTKSSELHLDPEKVYFRVEASRTPQLHTREIELAEIQSRNEGNNWYILLKVTTKGMKDGEVKPRHYPLGDLIDPKKESFVQLIPNFYPLKLIDNDEDKKRDQTLGRELVGHLLKLVDRTLPS